MPHHSGGYLVTRAQSVLASLVFTVAVAGTVAGLVAWLHQMNQPASSALLSGLNRVGTSRNRSGTLRMRPWSTPELALDWIVHAAAELRAHRRPGRCSQQHVGIQQRLRRGRRLVGDTPHNAGLLADARQSPAREHEWTFRCHRQRVCASTTGKRRYCLLFRRDEDEDCGRA